MSMSDQPAPNPSKLWSKCIGSAIYGCLNSCIAQPEISSMQFQSCGIMSRPQRWRQRFKCSEPMHKFRALGRRNVDHDRCLVGSDCSCPFCKCNMAAPSILKPPWVFSIFFLPQPSSIPISSTCFMYSLVFMSIKYHSCLLYISLPSCQHDHVEETKHERRGNDWGRHIPEALCSQSLGIGLTPIRLGQKPGKSLAFVVMKWQGSSNKSFEMRSNTTTHGIGWKKSTKQSWNWEGSQCWQCSSPCLTINPCSAAATDWRQGHASLEHQGRGGLYWMLIPEKVHKYSELTDYTWNNWRKSINHTIMH